MSLLLKAHKNAYVYYLSRNVYNETWSLFPLWKQYKRCSSKTQYSSTPRYSYLSNERKHIIKYIIHFLIGSKEERLRTFRKQLLGTPPSLIGGISAHDASTIMSQDFKVINLIHITKKQRLMKVCKTMINSGNY